MSVDKRKRRRGNKGKGSNTRNKDTSPDETPVLNYKPHRTPLLHTEESIAWFDAAKQIPGRNGSIFDTEIKSSAARNSELARKYRSIGQEIFRVETQLASGGGGASAEKSSSDIRWVENTMKKGTLKDRIAATSVILSSDPVHKISSLDNLLSMAGCSDSGQSNSRVSQMAAEALEDLFLNTLLPTDRKLLNLNQRPLALYEDSPEKTLSPRLLLLWYFEEMLKDRYQSFVDRFLATTLKDGIESTKIFALRVTSALLISCVEGETQLLSLIVNKLGDPGKKIAAAAAHELRRVLDKHENMQIVIAREVQQLAHRPQLSQRALYNCIVYLNQLRLRREEEMVDDLHHSPSLIVSLVNTYFRMFDVAMRASDEKTGMKSRLLSALLTGINRAHPYLPDKDQGLEEHIDALYNVVHVAAPAASTQAMMLLFHVAVGLSDRKDATEAQKKKHDRFYRAVYAKLSLPSFLSNGKHLTMFFNLLYKAMKYDPDSTRVLVFSKRLMCTVVHANAPVLAATLFLLNELAQTHNVIVKCFNEVPSFNAAALELDPNKREPTGALLNNVNDDGRKIDSIPPLWESCLAANHYHPSVGKFASSVGAINYTGDPLRDFSLAPFLDKFSYKNPKTRQKSKLSIARRRIENQVYEPVNDLKFLGKDKINAQDQFFHTFFLEQARRDKIKGISRHKNTKSEDLDEDEGFEMLEIGEVDKKLEDGFSTDDEEEEFVDKLALSLMEETIEDDDLDDEDPDMKGWENLHQEGDGENEDLVQVDSENELEFSDNDESNPSQSDLNDADEDAFMDNIDSSDDEATNVQASFDSKQKKKSNDNVFASAEDYEHLIKESYKKKKVEKVSGTQKRLRRK